MTGFATVKKTGIVLHVGMTATVDLTLGTAKLEKEVVVTAVAPLVDVTDASVGKSIIGTDVLQNIPMSQDVSKILFLSAGSVETKAAGGTDGYVFGGGRVSNSFSMDGVEISGSLAGSGSGSWNNAGQVAVDFNAVEEVQVQGLGAPAEYGNYTGASTLILTKSGGNRFSGDAQLLYEGKTWQSKNPDITAGDPYWSQVPETPLRSSVDASVHLGGAFIKDKLWFFTGFNYISTNNEFKTLSKTRTMRFPKAFVKLTYQPGERDRIQASFDYHNPTIHKLGSPLDAPEADYKNSGPAYIGNLSYIHTFSPSTILEIKGGGYSMNQGLSAENGDNETPSHYDMYTGARSGSFGITNMGNQSRMGISASLTQSVEDLMGSHDFKVGLQFEHSKGTAEIKYNSDLFYYDYNGGPMYAENWHYKQSGTINQYSFYVQDSWKISKSLVLDPGLRYDIYNGSVPTKAGVYTPKSLEPRIGLVWDVFPSHRTAVKAHYGRYNEGTKVYNFASLSPNYDDIMYFVGPNWESLTVMSITPGANLYSIDPKIKHPTSDQVVVGLEQVLGKNLSASVSIIYKHYIHMIDSVNTTGTYEPISYTDPVTGQVMTLYTQTNPGDNHYYITNPEKGKDYGAAYPNIVSFTPERTYKAFSVSVSKRFADNWQLFASYVYSKDTGSYSDEDISGTTALFQDPNKQINNVGIMPGSVPHIFKVQGTYIFPLDINLSFFYNYNTGATWTTSAYTPINQWLYNGTLVEKRGSHRVPAVSNLDLRLEKSFYAKDVKLSLTLDAFNIFNRGQVLSVYSIESALLGNPSLVQDSRSFRAGVKIVF